MAEILKPLGFKERSRFSLKRARRGGPHVDHTLVIGKFKILKEEAVAAGVRRIRATVE